MANVIYVQPNGVRETVDVPPGMTVMQGAVDCGIDGIIGACAGSCACGSCHVYVDNSWLARLPPMSREEDDKLDEVAAPVKRNSRMACRIVVTPQLHGLVINIPSTQG
jgi:ferredoxin, 2Fe-2S